MIEENWKHLNEKVDKQLKQWSRRNLSISGNIQVVK